MSNIKLFKNKQVRSIWSEAEGKWYFSVQDVFVIYPGLIVAMLGELSFCFWLLFKGINIEKTTND